jgi:cysteine-rich repeat protein
VRPLLRCAIGVAALVAPLFVGCNAITGAGDPEVIEGEGGSAATFASTGETTDASSAAGVGGGVDDEGPEVPFPCGDGVVGEGEQCDDGNVISGDGCDEHCHLQCGPGEAPRLPQLTCLSISGIDDERSWEDARSACQERGGDLAILDDLDVSSLDGRFDLPAHIGGLRASEDDRFEWIDGATVEDQVLGATADGADCLAGSAVSTKDEGRLALRAMTCDQRARFICERDPMGAN